MEFGFPKAHSRLTPSRGMLYLSLSPSWNCCSDSTNPQFLRGNVDNHAEAPFSESRVICLKSEELHVLSINHLCCIQFEGAIICVNICMYC